MSLWATAGTEIRRLSFLVCHGARTVTSLGGSCSVEL